MSYRSEIIESNDGSSYFNNCYYSSTHIAGKKNYSSLLLEALLYISLVGRVFGNQLGILRIAGLSGAIIVSAGLLCVLIMVLKQERFPQSVLFAGIVNIIANITDLYHIGLFSRDMIYWVSVLLMVCYLVRNPNSALRFEFFLAAMVLLSVGMSGVMVTQKLGYDRLALKGQGIGSMFADPNDLAQLASVTAAALLFSSHRSKSLIKLVCWFCAIALSAVVMLTLSRQGVILLTVGVFYYIVAFMGKARGKLWFILFIAIILTVSYMFSNEIGSVIDGYKYRFGLSSDRIDYWKTAPQDMIETLISGNGYYKGFSSTGINPHSTFLWLHFAYGGICAWTFVAWVGWLLTKTCQNALDKDVDWVQKNEILAMFSLFFAAQFTTVFAPGNYGYILAVALMEKQFHLVHEVDSA